MQFICEAPGQKTWFRIETEGEAVDDAEAMRHAMDYRFRHERQLAIRSYNPNTDARTAENGLGAHLRRTMPIFLTLRGSDGLPLATAIVPQIAGYYAANVVGPSYTDAYAREQDAIAALEAHLGRSLRRESYSPLDSNPA